MKNIEDWIYKEMVGEDEFIHTSYFESSLPIYFTPLGNNFVSTIINGSGIPAGFNVAAGDAQYNYLIRKVASVTGHEAAVWFYFGVIDNAVGQLNDVWECNYEYSCDYPLEKFERQPAEQGGVSFLGLLGENKSWLLLHTYEPGESFEITFHGAESIVGSLKSALAKSN